MTPWVPNADISKNKLRLAAQGGVPGFIVILKMAPFGWYFIGKPNRKPVYFTNPDSQVNIILQTGVGTWGAIARPDGSERGWK